MNRSTLLLIILSSCFLGCVSSNNYLHEGVWKVDVDKTMALMKENGIPEHVDPSKIKIEFLEQMYYKFIGDKWSYKVPFCGQMNEYSGTLKVCSVGGQEIVLCARLDHKPFKSISELGKEEMFPGVRLPMYEGLSFINKDEVETFSFVSMGPKKKPEKRKDGVVLVRDKDFKVRTVQEGENLRILGMMWGLPPDKIVEFNQLEKNELEVGQRIIIPPMKYFDRDTVPVRSQKSSEAEKSD